MGPFYQDSLRQLPFPSYTQSDMTQQMTQLRQLSSTPSSPVGRDSSEDILWSNVQRYSRPGGHDAQKAPSPCVSGPPPAVTVTSAAPKVTSPNAPASPPLYSLLSPKNMPWFGTEEQAFLNEYYKSHPYPQIKNENQISNQNYPNIANRGNPMNKKMAESLTIQSTAPPLMSQSLTLANSNSAPNTFRSSSVPSPPKSEGPGAVVFLRNYGTIQSPNLQMVRGQTSSVTGFSTPGVKKFHHLPNFQTPQNQHKGAEYLQMNGGNGFVVNSLPMLQFPNASVSQNDMMQQSLGPFAKCPFCRPAKSYQSHPYDPFRGLQTPSPLHSSLSLPPNTVFNTAPNTAPNTVSNMELSTTPNAVAERRPSPPTQRPRPHSFVNTDEQPPYQVWQAPVQKPNGSPSHSANALIQHVFPFPPAETKKETEDELRQSPPTPPNEPRRFKPLTLPSNLMWVPGTPPIPQDPPPPPPKPTPRPPRFGFQSMNNVQPMGDYPRLQESSRPSIYSDTSKTQRCS